MIEVSKINVLDLLKYKNLVLTKQSLFELEKHIEQLTSKGYIKVKAQPQVEQEFKEPFDQNKQLRIPVLQDYYKEVMQLKEEGKLQPYIDSMRKQRVHKSLINYEK